MNGRSLVAGVLVACLSASAVNAQTLREAIAREAAQTTSAPVQQSSGGGGKGLIWSGVALIGAGVFYLAWASSMDTSGDTCAFGQCLDNADVRKARYALGGVLAGAGGVLLGVGLSKSRQNTPIVGIAPSGVVIGQRWVF